VNAPARGIGDKTVDALFDSAKARGTSAFDAIEAAAKTEAIRAGARKRLLAFKALVDDLRREAATASVHDLAERVLDATGFRKTLEREDTAESDARLENLAELLGSIREFEADAEQAGQAPTLSAYLERVSLVSDIDSVSQARGVTLMTVHGAKGLEFTTVLLTGMEEETFPYKGADGTSPEELDEERRLAYVAITRARERLYVSHVGMRTLFGRTRYAIGSRFLDDLPEAGVLRTRAARARAASVPFQGRRSFDGPGVPAPRPAAEESSERRIDYEAFDDLAYELRANLGPGSRVYHQRFGEGIVRRVENGNAPAVVASFPGFGERKVLMEYLSLGDSR
jgi:DNA helicase II / ATP-dependent DNA helicase PcrA